MNKQKKYLDNNCEITEFLNKELDAIKEPAEKTQDLKIQERHVKPIMKDPNESPIALETNGPETKNGTISNALYVNVRKEPNFESESLEVLRKGDKVTILGKVGDFYKVSTSVNKLAYISFEFVEEE